MAFLDNSGDIILDAVLTDAGRKRLAQGDGTFRVVKFALADDEIDYGLFNKFHPSGSAYYDLEIMQTPVLEAFTNNTSSLKHRLMSMSATNLLYLPVIKLHSNAGGHEAISMTVDSSGEITSAAKIGNNDVSGLGFFVVPADDTTASRLQDDQIPYLNPNLSIKVVQGVDNDDISFRRDLGNLVETQYIIQADYRMLRMTTVDQSNEKAESYVDDDMIASYYVSENVEGTTMIERPDGEQRGPNGVLLPEERIILGPIGTCLKFNLTQSEEINTSYSLFDELGGSELTKGTNEYKYLDTNVRVAGATTGSSIDIPIRIMKYNPN